MYLFFLIIIVTLIVATIVIKTIQNILHWSQEPKLTSPRWSREPKQIGPHWNQNPNKTGILWSRPSEQPSLTDLRWNREQTGLHRSNEDRYRGPRRRREASGVFLRSTFESKQTGLCLDREPNYTDPFLRDVPRHRNLRKDQAEIMSLFTQEELDRMDRQKKEDRCMRCNQRSWNKELILCEKCREFQYCSNECKTADGARHVRCCLIIGAMKGIPSVLSASKSSREDDLHSDASTESDSKQGKKKKKRNRRKNKTQKANSSSTSSTESTTTPTSTTAASSTNATKSSARKTETTSGTSSKGTDPSPGRWKGYPRPEYVDAQVLKDCVGLSFDMYKGELAAVNYGDGWVGGTKTGRPGVESAKARSTTKQNKPSSSQGRSKFDEFYGDVDDDNENDAEEEKKKGKKGEEGAGRGASGIVKQEESSKNEDEQPPPKPKLETCGYCKKSSYTMKKCARCQKVYYCDKTCQSQDYKEHKEFCRKKAQFQKAFDALTSPVRVDLASRFNLEGFTNNLENIPAENTWMLIGTRMALIVEIVDIYPHFLRHGVFVKDVNGFETFILFYAKENTVRNHCGHKSASKTSRPLPLSECLRPGNFILLLCPHWHAFMDGTTGFRIDDLDRVYIIFMDGR